jgi:hypothetical protein
MGLPPQDSPEEQPRQEDVERIGAFDPSKDYSIPVPPPSPLQPPYRPYGQSNFLFGRRQKVTPGGYNPAGRTFGIVLSISALVVTIVALFAIPLDFSDFDRTFLRVGMSDGMGTILIMTFVTLFIGIVALLMPFLNIASGLCLIVTGFIAYGEVGVDTFEGFFTTPGLIVFILIALDIIALGIISTVFMRKFVNNNLPGVPFFKACYLAWTGIPHL